MGDYRSQLRYLNTPQFILAIVIVPIIQVIPPGVVPNHIMKHQQNLDQINPCKSLKDQG